MRKSIRLAVLPALVLGCIIPMQALVASEGGPPGLSELVDFRMAPLEQAKKINQQLIDRNGAGQTYTIMSLERDKDRDGENLILKRGTADAIRCQLERGFGSVSWHQRPEEPMGSCDSDQDCEEKTDSMCEKAGHGGVDADTVSVTKHADGSKTCSGDCESNGAVAFVTCNPNR